MPRTGRAIVAAIGIAATVALGGPAAAQAHGPVAPVASSYLARVGHAPSGIEARVIDGDQSMWLRVLATEQVVVLDYGGAPYLRFSARGVEVNQSSAMYYLNQTPPETPPAGLTTATPPRWKSVSAGHEHGWHDGRLHALASVALAPGQSYAGRWQVPVTVDGRREAITGGLWHADAPSIVWFWPILVLLACVLAARRLRRPALDARIARILALAALAAIGVADVARGLYGRPTLSIPQLALFAITGAFVGWGLRRVLGRHAGYFSFFLVAFVAIWEGGVLTPALWHGFVLATLPAFVTRTTAVVCLACGIGLLMLGFWLADRPEDADAERSESGGLGEPASAGAALRQPLS